MRDVMDELGCSPAVIVVAGEKEKGLCSPHQASCDLYCLTCQEAVCYKCSFHLHRHHALQEVQPPVLSSDVSALSEHAVKQMGKVKVLYVESPVSIFVREVGLEEKYLEMREVLKKESVSCGYSNSGEIRVNSLVVCYRAASARWERGLVMAQDSQTLAVRLADIGKIEFIARSEVRLMGPELESFETLTQSVALSVGDSWSSESTCVLRELLDQKIVQMRRLGGRAVELFIEMITLTGPPRKSLVSVAEYLMEKGLANKKETSETCFNIKEKYLEPVVAEEESVSDSDSDSEHNCSLSPPSPSQTWRLPGEPVVPHTRVFRAKLTHIDSKGTVWVVPKDTCKLEGEIRRLIKASTISCPRQESKVGDLVVMRKNLSRGRIIHIDGGGEKVTLLDVDSGKKHRAAWSLLSLPTSALVERPPLALPLKLYGVKKTLAELTDVKDLHYDEVTVISLALNPQRFPLPANIRLANKSQSNAVGGNLALDLLEKGFFQLIKNQEDWTREFFDHGLDTELDPREKFVKEREGQSNYWSLATEEIKEIELLNMKSLPHPLPLSDGQWLSVRVEEVVKDLKDGTESEPSLETRHGSQVWCSLWPITAPGLQEEVAASASIINPGLETLQREFLEFEEELVFKIISAKHLDNVCIGQEVLAHHQNQDEVAWSRAVIRHIKEDGSLVVSYTDYGYRGDVARERVRAITLEQRMEPSHVRDFYFKMPRGNQELREIRNALGNADMARVEEIKISEEGGEEVQVSFWGLKKGGIGGNYARIC